MMSLVSVYEAVITGGFFAASSVCRRAREARLADITASANPTPASI